MDSTRICEYLAENVKISSVSIESNNPSNNKKATLGDTVTLTIETIGIIYNLNEIDVRIAGQQVNARIYNEDLEEYSAKYIAELVLTKDVIKDIILDDTDDDLDAEGKMSISIRNYESSVGNRGETINETTLNDGEQSYVELDIEELLANNGLEDPNIEIIEASIESDNPSGNKKVATVNDTITLKIKTNGRIYNLNEMDARIAGQQVNVIMSNEDLENDSYIYTGKLVLTQEVIDEITEGEMSISIRNYEDIYGNKGEYIDRTTDNSYVELDTTGPKIESISVNGYNGTSNESKTVLKNGDRVVITVNIDETIQQNEELPKLTIKFENNDDDKVLSGNVSGNKIIYRYTVTSGDNGKLSIVSLLGKIIDIPGNESEVTTLPSNINTNNVKADTEAPQIYRVNIDLLDEENYKEKEIVKITEDGRIGAEYEFEDGSIYLIGDVNKDNKINDVDYNLIGDYLASREELDDYSIKLADVDGDGEVSSLDEVALKRYYKVIPTTYIARTQIAIDVTFTEMVYDNGEGLPKLIVRGVNITGEDITEDTDSVTTIRYIYNTNNKADGEILINGLTSEGGLYDEAGNKLDVSSISDPVDYTVMDTNSIIIIDKTAPYIKWFDEGTGNVVNGIMYTKYCDFKEQNIIKDKNFNDEREITLTLKDVYGDTIQNYANVKYTDLTEMRLQDGEYYLDITDALGNTQTIHFAIDNEAPILNVIYQKAQDGHVEHVSLNRYVDENISLDRIKLYKVNNSTLNNIGGALTYNYLVDNIVPGAEATTYKVVAIDYAGNETIKYFKVDLRDTEVEGIEVRYVKSRIGYGQWVLGEDEYQNTVTISSSEYLQELDGWSLSNDRKSLTKVYTTNTIETVTIEDLCGNTKNIYIKVTDIEGPVLTIERKEGHEQYVKNDEEIVLVISSDKAIKLEQCQINGKDVTVNNGTEYRNIYEVSAIVDNSMSDGMITVSYTCTYEDQNEGTKSGSTLTDEYIIDRTAPTENSFRVVGYDNNTGFEKTKLKTGDRITFTSIFNEEIELLENPILKIKIGSGEAKEDIIGLLTYGYDDNNEKIYKIVYTYVVSQDDEGVINIISLNEKVSDAAGNESTITKSNIQTDIEVDNTAPYIENIEAVAVRIGDVNLDGEITQADARLIQTVIASIDEDNELFDILADVDKNGEVNIFDASLIEKYLSGQYEINDIIYTNSGDTYIGSERVIKIIVNASEELKGTTVPSLKIKIGEKDVTLTNGQISEDEIVYTFVTDNENGKVEITAIEGGNMTDEAGNSLDKSLSENLDTKFYVDTTPPEVITNLVEGNTKTLSKDNIIYINDFIEYIATSDLSGIKTAILKLDDEIINGYRLTYTIARDGNWTLEVTDNVGNTASYSFVIDTVGPLIKLNGEDQNNVESIDNITIEVTDNNLDKIELYRNGSKVTDFNYNIQRTIYQSGSYRIEAIDKAGNVTIKIFDVVRKMPTVDMYLDDTEDKYTSRTWTNHSVRVSLNVEDIENLSAIEYRTNENEAWRTLVGSEMTISTTGEYEFEARAKYNNNKYSAITEKQFIKIDKVKPTIGDIQITPSDGIELVNGYYNGSINITIPVGEDANSGIKSNKYTINSEEGTYTSEATKTLNVSGTYTIEYYSLDNAGNESDHKRLTIKIDKNAPVINYTDEDDNNITGEVVEEYDYILVDDDFVNISEFTYFNKYVKLNISDDESGIDEDSIKLYKYYDEINKYVEYQDMAIMRDGRYIITVKDNVGNVLVKGFVVDTTAPVIRINGTEYPENDSTNYYKQDVEIDVLDNRVLINDADIKVYIKGQNGQYTEEYSFLNSIHKITEDGAYKIVAKDELENTSVVYIIIDRQAPSFTKTLTPDANTWTNGNVKLKVTPQDSTSGVKSVTVNGQELALNINGIAEAVLQANGNYIITVIDNSGNGVSDTVTVSNIDKDVPVISSVTINPQTEAESVTLTVVATDVGSGITGFSWDNGQTWQESNEFDVTSNGTYTVIVKDKAGNISQANSINVSNIIEQDLEQYFRITNYTQKIEQNTKYVTGISTHTTVESFKNYIQVKNLSYTIYDRKGNVVSNNDLVATNMKIRVSDGSEYILVVRGDLNSDGIVDISDLSNLATYFVGKSNLARAYVLAGDIVNDGIIDVSDISNLAITITKKISL